MDGLEHPIPSSSDSDEDARWDGVFSELAKFDRISAEAATPVLPSPPSESDAPAYRRVIHPPPGMNPVPVPGIEYALLEAGATLETLVPSHLPDIAVVDEGAIVAVRDSLQGANIHPGQNLASRMLRGRETLVARHRGQVVLIGKDLHVLPADRDGALFVRISADNMSAMVSVRPGYGRGKAPDFDLAVDTLRKSGVCYGILEDELREALEQSRAGSKPLSGIRIAEGVRPVPGTAGSVEYFFDREAAGPANLSPGPDGKIDFRDVKWVPMVMKDHLLARITPSVSSREGRNVLGETIAVKETALVYLLAGKNVRVEKAETEFYSEISGCAQLNGTRLDVMNVYVVNSDVDYHTGNVRFEGNVLVTGTVRKGFEVECQGDIIVLGNAEPCRLKAGKDVVVKGGILGSGKSGFRVEAGRHIVANYCEHALLEAQGDIRIENYAMQSFLYSCGWIRLDGGVRCSIIGGETLALRGIEAKSLGSEACIRTSIAVGINFVVRRQLEHLGHQKAELEASMEKIDRFLKSMLEAARHSPLPPAKTETLKAIAEKRKAMAKTFSSMAVKVTELEGMKGSGESARVRASNAVHSEVSITIHGKSLKVVQSARRSEFYFDPKTEDVVRKSG